jgi:hypothetical protein
VERLERFKVLLLAGGLTIPLEGLTPVPETEYSKPVRNDSERMFSLMIVFDSVRLVTKPWEKFGTTGTAAAGEANNSRKISRITV